MACFIVPAIVGIGAHSQRKKFPVWAHVNWLVAMVLGGAVALAVEHYAHGEIVPWPPFLTAMASPAQTTVMLNEMAAVGIPMTIALVAAWVGMIIVYEKFMAKDDARAGAVAAN
ncbi:Uncharacterised protein [uncultured archaeon]|nr:Uncharacterised protein [uncultured archaeon]